MPSSITMTDKQHCLAGVTLLDMDGQPFVALPPGLALEFSTDNPTVANFTVDPTGFNIDISSGVVGTAIITATVTGLGEPKSDTLAVAVTNSAPGSLNFTPGVPIDE